MDSCINYGCITMSGSASLWGLVRMFDMICHHKKLSSYMSSNLMHNYVFPHSDLTINFAYLKAEK